jgi:hypothetical protein
VSTPTVSVTPKRLDLSLYAGDGASIRVTAATSNQWDLIAGPGDAIVDTYG